MLEISAFVHLAYPPRTNDCKEEFFTLIVDCADERAGQEAKARWDSIAKPLGSLGLLEEAVIRTAEALGLSALLLSDGCCDPYNPKVLRGSMGGVFQICIRDSCTRASNGW